jgi:primary-amine oxidase
MHTHSGPTKAIFIHHPLDQLDSHEIDTARETVLKARGHVAILFRAIFTQEPSKADLIPFLDAEHSGNLPSANSRPLRLAKVQYDVINDDRSHDYMESVVDIAARAEIKHRVVGKEHQSALTLEEFKAFQEACFKSPLYTEAISKFDLPDGFEVIIDPW